ncbi:MAG TPA: phosphate signaling complex protein PhoU [Rhodocyclaceae bacterium]|jgi:phosphate transport system protein|nr:phosphate signaling complex protein PhoU [Rhodocyclaceae bacterium]
MNDHIAKQFDADLENIRNRVLQMGGLVEQLIVMAMDGLSSGDMLVIDEAITTDERVNRHEVELDEACTQIIARRQPTASDLRMVMTVVKTITDLERIGDEAKKIAKMAKQIHGSDFHSAPAIEFRHVSGMVVSMLRQALDAFARLDVVAAGQVVRTDQEVDVEFKSAMRQLITYMMEDPRTISRSLDMVFIAKAIERIGDHSKNIAEYVIYMVKGRDVRHIGLAEIEREIAS